ncbi:putative type-1 restriction enzyme specificity protein MPN_089, partial [Candidatus Mycoplasma haematohominis]
KEKAIAGGNMFLLTHNQNPKYLSYALSTHHAKLQKQKYAKEGAIVSISTNGLKKIKIPLPPLEIQKQISETLDVLRELVRELVRELETELKLRKKQYRYYLNKLISDVIEKGWGEYRTLGEIIETQKGFSFDNKKYSKTGLPIIKVLNVQNGQINTNELVFFNPEDYQRDLNKFILRKGEVCITTDGASSGKIAINNHDSNFYISASVCKLNAKKEIIPKYLYYSLLSKEKEIHKLIQGTAVMHLYPEDLKKLKIPLPPLEIQEQIANVLDRLRELCEDLEKEMPKEIELSKQRYKYYKELLIIGKR